MTLIILMSLVLGILSFLMKMNYILMLLINLEFLVLLIFLVLILNFNETSMALSLYYLIFSACEGALGLTIMVCMARAYGGDYPSSLSLNI